MIDLSDGLALDARRVALASGVALDLSTGSVGSREALDGGEDHSLLATFPAGAGLPGGFRVIGHVVEGSGLLVDGVALRGAWWLGPLRGLGRGARMSPNALANADLFAALGDARRRRILELLAVAERPVGALAAELGIAQPSVTQHLAVLREVGLVRSERRGTSSIYSLVREPLAGVTAWIEGL